MNRRVIRNAAYMLMAGTLFIHAFLIWNERSLIVKGYPDFTIFYSAGLMMREGLSHQLYEDAVQYRVQRTFASGVQIRQGPLPYNHPPFEALLFVPLTFLPYPIAYATWDLLNLAMLALMVRVLRAHIAILSRKPLAFWLLALLAFFPIAFALLQGQDMLLLLLLDALAYAALKRDSDLLAGCWLGLGSFKYHLIVPLVLIISLGCKRYRVALGFLAASLCLGASSIAIVGWQQALNYPRYVLYQERVMGHGSILPANMPNLRGLLVGWHSWQAIAVPRSAVLVLSFALLLWAVSSLRKKRGRLEWQFSVASIVSILISYHTFAYDLVLLTIPLLTILNLFVAKDTGRAHSELSPVTLREYATLFFPPALLLLTPLYILLAFHFVHLNLLALVLLVWLWGIQQRISTRLT